MATQIIKRKIGEFTVELWTGKPEDLEIIYYDSGENKDVYTYVNKDELVEMIKFIEEFEDE